MFPSFTNSISDISCQNTFNRDLTIINTCASSTPATPHHVYDTATLFVLTYLKAFCRYPEPNPCHIHAVHTKLPTDTCTMDPVIYKSPQI